MASPVWCLILTVISMQRGQPPALPPDPAPSAHPGRQAPAEQPDPIERPTAKPSQRWSVQALVQRMGTGKAAGTLIVEKSPKMYAATKDDALLKQQDFINSYLHPQVAEHSRRRHA